MKTMAINNKKFKPLVLLLGILSILIESAGKAMAMENQNNVVPSDSLSELLDLDIAQLMELKVVLPSRTAERQFDAPAAIYVITKEDIRRSGYSRIPDLLRLVPGLHVGRIDTNTWAISSRSDMTRLSNTMLVLLDGRTLYDPLYGGVYWDTQDALLDDIERIEIIRGPGASLWGANAMDGIINIVTKDAQQTQGSLVNAGAGNGDMKAEIAYRYGTKINHDVHGRFYIKSFSSGKGEYLDRKQSTNNGYFPVGSKAYDSGRQDQAGFRMDWKSGASETITLHGDIYAAEFDNVRSSNPRENTVAAKGRNIVGSWNRIINANSSLMIKGYYDYTQRVDKVFIEERDIIDFDLQHNLTLGVHGLTWGIGYRHSSDDTAKTPTGFFGLQPPSHSDDLFSAFIQDRYTIVEDSLYLTIGSKFEHNDYTGNEWQPSLRMLWKASPTKTLWASITRALHTPTRTELGGIIDPCSPNPVCAIGNPNAESQSVVATEIGYRSQMQTNLLLDLSVFNNRYHNTDDLGVAGANITTRGVEGVIKHDVFSGLKLEYGLVYHSGEHTDSFGSLGDNYLIPSQSAYLRTYYNLSPRLDMDTFVYYKDHVGSGSTTYQLEDYTAVNLRLGWHPVKGIYASLLVSNLFDKLHGEGIDAVRINTGVGRSFFAKLNYEFH